MKEKKLPLISTCIENKPIHRFRNSEVRLSVLAFYVCVYLIRQWWATPLRRSRILGLFSKYPQRAFPDTILKGCGDLLRRVQHSVPSLYEVHSALCKEWEMVGPSIGRNVNCSQFGQFSPT